MHVSGSEMDYEAANGIKTAINRLAAKKRAERIEREKKSKRG